MTTQTLKKIEQNILSGARINEQLVIGPDEAQWLLSPERNPQNRPKSFVDINSYARAMTDGKFEDNGDTIKVSKEGLLNDGQHRLEAVVLSGCSVTLSIAFGVSRDSRHTLDQGKRRSAGNIIDMSSDTAAYGNHQAAIASWLMHFDASNGKRVTNGRLKFLPSEIKDYALAHPAILNAITTVQPWAKGFNAHGSLSILGLSYYLLSNKPQGKQFVEQMATGKHNGDVVALLRSRLLKEGKTHAPRKIALILRAWNAYANNQTPKKLNAGKLVELPPIA